MAFISTKKPAVEPALALARFQGHCTQYSKYFLWRAGKLLWPFICLGRGAVEQNTTTFTCLGRDFGARSRTSQWLQEIRNGVTTSRAPSSGKESRGAPNAIETKPPPKKKKRDQCLPAMSAVRALYNAHFSATEANNNKSMGC